MTTQSEASVGSAEMLPGVRHYQTTGFANTWSVYDALTEQDGWSEKFSGDIARWKEVRLDGRWLVVHAPTHDRPDETTGEGR